VFVGVCRLSLLATHCHSLKEKRSVVRRVKDKTRTRFDIAIAEVGDQDKWQRITLGFAVVGNERAFIDTTLDKVIGFIEGLGVATVAGDEHEVLNYGDEPIGRGDDTGWVPTEWRDGEDDEPR
jgi:uncharacterized protein YlxP (DUF503 family)